MKLQIQLTFKQGPQVIAKVVGREIDTEVVPWSVDDVNQKVVETEAYLERLTGLRVHIEQVL